jgi:hypothetical protein
MLRPFLLVGVGGSGGKTLRAVRQALQLRLLQEGWKGDWPSAWQFLHVDSPTVQDGSKFPAPFLPLENYQGLVPTGSAYKQAYEEVLRPGRMPSEFIQDAEKPLPSKEEVTIPVDLGAGQYRAVGRTLALAKLSSIGKAAQAAITRLNSAEARGQLEAIGALLGAKPGNTTSDPIVIVVSSIAGGSGAGQYIDVVEAVKSAAPASNWVHRIFAMLYAPDVFAKIDGKGGIEPNALAAFSEAMAGLWREAPTPATSALYQSHGLVVPSNKTEYHLGPAYTYVIGRRNSIVDFDDQPAVYNAVAASLTTWITDDDLQDSMLAYAIANFDAQAKSEATLPDATGLKVPNRQAPPFSSIGFGRISLGRDRFLQYSSERLARSGIDLMLYKHAEEDPQFKTRTQDEWIAYKADSVVLDFINDLKLNEETEQHNDIIDALRPIEQREVLYANLKNQVLADSQQGLDKSGGQSISNWHDKLIHFYQSYVERSIDEETNYRHAKARDWVSATSDRTQKVVAQYISQYGLRVVSELLNRLEMKLDAVSKELQTEAASYHRYASEVRAYVGQELQRAQGHESLRPDHPAVQAAAEQCKNALGWRAEADLREMAVDLMRDFAKNFVEPLRITISGGERALLARATDALDTTGRENPYLTWAKADSQVVPNRFTPAKNERLLVDVASYPAEFSELIKRSVDKDRSSNAFGVVMDQVLMGSLELEDLDEDATWSLLDLKREWIPNYRGARKDSSQASQPVQIEFSSDPNEYLRRAQWWMERKGTAFYAYLHEDLASYLDENMKDKAEFTARLSKFRVEFSAAVSASEPLVKLNPSLLMSVHGKTLDEVSTSVSAIPFPVGGQLFQEVKNAMQSAKLWDESNSDKWFRDMKVQNIDIFSTLKFPYQPMVMDSLVQPIAEQWQEARNNPKTRESFLKWRRARSLCESIPLAEDVRDKMLRGWYVAKTLSQVSDLTSNALLGPEISIFNPAQSINLKFPHPLMHSGFCPPYDYPAVLLKSVSIAIVMCNAQGGLDPLLPYQRLSELGHEKEMLAPELTDWIHYGNLQQGAPTPRAERAGSANGTFEERRDAVINYLNQQEAEFREDVISQNPQAELRSYGLSWELRSEILTAIHDLKNAVTGLRSARSGT